MIPQICVKLKAIEKLLANVKERLRATAHHRPEASVEVLEKKVSF